MRKLDSWRVKVLKACCCCIKGKDSNFMMDTAKILERWSEHIEELVDDNRGSIPEIQ